MKRQASCCSWEIRQGDALERLREMPDESVQCCVTSPPYWGLRDYGVDGQLGLEETPEEYVQKLVTIFSEVRRVLRSDGTAWLNIGDSYASSGVMGKQSSAAHLGVGTDGSVRMRGGVPGVNPKMREQVFGRAPTPDSCKPKDLVGIPWMLAFALRADGWYLRRDIIWSKPNPMPESVTDRPTSSHEYVFLLTKSPRYFYDAEAIREPGVWAGQNRSDRGPRDSEMPGAPPHNGLRQDKQRGHGRRHDGFNDRWDAMSKDEQQALGRNKRSVWTIATKPFAAAHFATFPPDLVEPCIKAGTAAANCSECGTPWRRITESEFVPQADVAESPALDRSADGLDESSGWAGTPCGNTRRVTLGFEPTCAHGAPPAQATVLDPFAGAATTGLVATQLGRSFIGIELNPEYIQLGEDRIHRWEANPAGYLKGDPEPLEGQETLDLGAAA